jgi:lactoylglutathione lyase
METATSTAINPAADFALRLNFFKIIVKDVDAMVAFYTGAFGFEVQNHITLPGMVEVMLALPKQQFNLVLYHWTDGREITVGNGYGPIGLLTNDVDGACRHALSLGAQMKREPFDLSNMRIAFLTDPEGHELELITFKPA